MYSISLREFWKGLKIGNMELQKAIEEFNYFTKRIGHEFSKKDGSEYTYYYDDVLLMPKGMWDKISPDKQPFLLKNEQRIFKAEESVEYEVVLVGIEGVLVKYTSEEIREQYIVQ